VFAGSLIGFAIAIGLIVAGGKPAPATSADDPTMAAPAAGSSRVLAEVPIAGLGEDGRETIIRIVAPASETPEAHVRTRATS
jgi:hypothetical protein